MGVSTAGWGRLPLTGDAGCLTKCRKNTLTRPPSENRFEGPEKGRRGEPGTGEAETDRQGPPACLTRKGVGSPGPTSRFLTPKGFSCTQSSLLPESRLSSVKVLGLPTKLHKTRI